MWEFNPLPAYPLAGRVLNALERRVCPATFDEIRTAVAVRPDREKALTKALMWLAQRRLVYEVDFEFDITPTGRQLVELVRRKGAGVWQQHQ